jgi:uncharacterized protein YqkB
MAIIQQNRLETAGKVQDVLSKNGCHIRVRLGLHEANINSCDNSGIILLQLCSENTSVAADMEKELKAIPGVKVKYMVLD